MDESWMTAMAKPAPAGDTQACSAGETDHRRPAIGTAETPAHPIDLDPGELSNRTYGALRRYGIFYLDQAACLTKRELLLIPGIGSKGGGLIERSLLRRGMRLPER